MDRVRGRERERTKASWETSKKKENSRYPPAQSSGLSQSASQSVSSQPYRPRRSLPGALGLKLVRKKFHKIRSQQSQHTFEGTQTAMLYLSSSYQSRRKTAQGLAKVRDKEPHIPNILLIGLGAQK